MNPIRNCISLGLGMSLTLLTSPDALANAGLRSTLSGNPLDRLALPQQRVVSDRGADFLSPLGIRSGFRSDTTPPAPGRRVRVWNLTDGFRSEAPFTERDYASEVGAEPFILVPDAQHRTRWFSVIPGSEDTPKQNDFRYEIVDAQGEVLESGEFSVEISLNPAPLTTTFRYGPEYRDRDSPTNSPTNYHGLGHAMGRGRYGHLWNERRLFKQRQQFKRDNSPLYRLRERR